MKAKDAELAAELHRALVELPKVRRQIRSGKSKHYDGYSLEIQSAEMSDGVGQGSDHYFFVPKEISGQVLDEVERLIKVKLRAIGVDL